MAETKNNKLKFIDFCAGIGGGKIGLANLGMQCVGFSEIALSYIKTYRLFFGNNEPNYGDLMKINPADLPDFDFCRFSLSNFFRYWSENRNEGL